MSEGGGGVQVDLYLQILWCAERWKMWSSSELFCVTPVLYLQISVKSIVAFDCILFRSLRSQNE